MCAITYCCLLGTPADILLRFRFYAFVQAAALGSIVLLHVGVPIATRVFPSFFSPFCLFGDVVFSEYFFVSFPLSLCMDYRVRYTFFPSEWCISTL